jgi:hypothetical protein
VIHRRFHGPPASGHGGYTCGLLAREFQGAAQVSLRSPPPLERPLTIERDGRGRLRLRDGDAIIADAQPATLKIDPPPPVQVVNAQAASSRYAGFVHHPFPTCFACGPDRGEADGLRLFPGPVEDRDVVACVWRPDSALADAAGNVRPEFVWAALDCPTAFACEQNGTPIVLARLTGRIDEPLRADNEFVITAWRMGGVGRKQRAACVISTADGETCAASDALWVAPRDPNAFGAATGGVRPI